MRIIAQKYQNSSYLNPTSFQAIPKGYTKIDDYLIRGPHPSVKTLLALKKEGVNQVYDFRHVGCVGFKFIEKAFCKLLGISYIRMPFSSLYHNNPTLPDFERVAAAVKLNGEQGGKTFLHCNSSRHRTAHFATFYCVTKGQPLSKVAQQPDYVSRVERAVKEQILERNYFSRQFKKYDGFNPIKRFYTKINNQYAVELSYAHAEFLDMFNKLLHS